MALFQPAESTSAFLKSGFMGFQGSGKTKTMALLAIGLVLHMRKLGIEYAKRPVFFLDTETGSDWVKPDFDEMGIELHVAKTRAFSDLIGAIDEAQKSASFLLTDSVTHFWTELTSSYAAAKARQLKISSGIYRLQFQDWAYLKGPQGWQQFTDRYVNSALHMGVAGRAGFEYDYFEDDEGKKQLEKTGVKMKAEGEFGFEPSLLVQMETCQRLEGKAIAKVWREAHVVKDRSTLIDGKTFIFTGEDDAGTRLSTADLVLQTFRAFQPHIKRLNLGGRQLGVDTSRTSEHLVPVEKRDWHSVQKTIVLEEIEAVLAEHFPSTKAEDKQAKAAMQLKHFETRSWTEVENMRVDDLRLNFDALYRELKGEPSRYTAVVAQENTTTDINDSLPDHSAPPAATADAPLDPAQLEAQLLADIPNNKTLPDCLRWALTISGDTRLPHDAINRLNTALMAHQAAVMKQGKPAAEPAKEQTPDKDDAPKGGEQVDIVTEDPKTGAPAYLTRKPINADRGKPAAERTMADLMSAG